MMNEQSARLNLLWPGLWLALTVVFAVLFALLPLDRPLLFYDWHVFFEDPSRVPTYYPPWTAYVVQVLCLPLLLAVTLSSAVVAVLRKAQSLVSGMCAFLTLPLVWTLFLGQLDGLALLGVLALPYTAPLALLKPQVAAFALLARPRWVLVGAVFVVLTVVLWGLWPVELFTCHADDPKGMWPQDIALGLWGLPLFALMVWRMPRSDPDWWMLAGATITPRLIPYHLLPLMPAVARLRWRWALAVAFASWLPLAANWLGAWAWRLGWVSVGLLAVGLWLSEREAGDADDRSL